MNAEPETGTEVQGVGLGPQELEGEGHETRKGEKPTRTAVSELRLLWATEALSCWGSSEEPGGVQNSYRIFQDGGQARQRHLLADPHLPLVED